MSARDNFWTAVFRWWEQQSRLRVNLSGSSRNELTFTAVVHSVDGDRVTLQVAEPEIGHEIDFSNAKIRAHSVEPIDWVVSFQAAWEGDSGSVLCFLTEWREFGKPN
jgi:hypothetical protein